MAVNENKGEEEGEDAVDTTIIIIQRLISEEDLDE